jgi:hypothetical protein
MNDPENLLTIAEVALIGRAPVSTVRPPADRASLS